MAWLARSLANSLRLEADDGDGGDGEEEGEEEQRGGNDHRPPPRSSTDSHGSLDRDRSGFDAIERESAEEWQSRGVKEDLNELTETLTRQFWGVANFLAPPPSQPSTPSLSDPAVNEWDRFGTPGRGSVSSSEGKELPDDEVIKEVGVSEMDSRLEPIESGGEDGDEEEFEEVELIGITDEVLAFARNIAMHPETWLDFPLDSEDDLNDFKMTDAQQEHVLAIESLAPRLRALRIELCPCHMTESYFWKVYFVLLHSRLEKHDADILSTPQVMEARAMWMRELKKQTEPEYDWPGISTYNSNEYENDDMLQDEVYPGSPSYFNAQSHPFRPSRFEHERSSKMMDSEIEKPQLASSESQIDEKSASGANTKVRDSPRMPAQNFDIGDDDDDDWPEEEDSDLVGYSGAFAPVGIEEDISFSDLEDDLDDVSMPIRSKPSVSDGGQERESS